MFFVLCGQVMCQHMWADARRTLSLQEVMNPVPHIPRCLTVNVELNHDNGGKLTCIVSLPAPPQQLSQSRLRNDFSTDWFHLAGYQV